MKAAIDAIQKFKRENPDAWQLVPLTATLSLVSCSTRTRRTPKPPAGRTTN